MLWNKNVTFVGAEKGSVGIFTDFDYLHNAVYKLSATSIGAKMINNYILSRSVELFTTASLTGIILGGSNSVHAEEELGRDYNLGPGLNIEVETSITAVGIGSVYMQGRHYWIHTVHGADGDEMLLFFTVGTSINVFSKINIHLEYLQYNRWAHYKDYPSVEKNNFAIRNYISWTF
jgi:hypothetical protein